MTPKELDGLRCLIAAAPGSIDLEEAAKMLLEHIDRQASKIGYLIEAHDNFQDVTKQIIKEKDAQITARNTEIDRDRNIIEFLEKELQKDSGQRYADLQAVCDDQDKQIAALKELAISEREKEVVRGFASSLHWNSPERIEKTKAKVKELARLQLEHEHPEAMR